MQNGPKTKMMPTQAKTLAEITMAIFIRTSILLSLTVLALLLCNAMAFAGKVQIHIHEHGISGYAHKARLTDVLGQLSAQTGSTVFIDEALADTRVTFEIPVPMPAEYAVRRMIHPLSHAMVYSRVVGQQQLVVEEIKIYSQSKKTTRFVHVPSSDFHNIAGEAASEGTMSGSTTSGKHRLVGSLDPRKQIRKPVSFSDGVFGNTRYHIDPSTNGPDYRPTQSTMSGRYSEQRIASRAYQQTSTQSAMQSSRENDTSNRDQYRHERVLSIQKSVSGNPN
jgi:hypothetical protein